MSDSRITAANGAFSAITAEPSVTFGGKGLEALERQNREHAAWSGAAAGPRALGAHHHGG